MAKGGMVFSRSAQEANQPLKRALQPVALPAAAPTQLAPPPPAAPVPAPPTQADLVKQAEEARAVDMARGEAIAKQQFGRGNEDMAKIIAQREALARGLTDPEFAALRQRGMEGINSSMQTGLRQLQSLNSKMGIRGGAATAGAQSVLARALQARSGLENDLAAQDIGLRRQGLDALESTITGERAGALSLPLSYAGLGIQDRANAQQALIQQQQMAQAEANLGAANAARPGPAWDARLANRFKDPRFNTVLSTIFGPAAVANTGIAAAADTIRRWF